MQNSVEIYPEINYRGNSIIYKRGVYGINVIRNDMIKNNVDNKLLEQYTSRFENVVPSFNDINTNKLIGVSLGLGIDKNNLEKYTSRFENVVPSFNDVSYSRMQTNSIIPRVNSEYDINKDNFKSNVDNMLKAIEDNTNYKYNQIVNAHKNEDDEYSYNQNNMFNSMKIYPFTKVTIYTNDVVDIDYDDGVHEYEYKKVKFYNGTDIMYEVPDIAVYGINNITRISVERNKKDDVQKYEIDTYERKHRIIERYDMQNYINIMIVILSLLMFMSVFIIYKYNKRCDGYVQNIHTTRFVDV